MSENKNIILVHAMSRAGQHPIIDWVYNQFNDDRLFLNYMFINDPNFLERRSQYYFNNKKYYYILNPNWKKYGVLEEKLREFNPETSDIFNRISLSKKNLLMMNFENVNLTDSKENIDKFEAQFVSNGSYTNVLIVRDIFNYLASKIKMGRYFHPEKNIENWKSHAKEYLKKTCCLNNKITINFNKWVTDPDYRKLKSVELKCDIFLPEWRQISSFGGGSSFDFLSFQGKGNEMAVFERWKEYRNNREFRKFLEDEELWELSESIFGHIQGTEELHNGI